MKDLKSDFKVLQNQNGKNVKAAFTIRPFVDDDAEQVAHLIHKYFPWQQNIDIKLLVQKITSDFARSESTPSLVCSNQYGKIHGYITVKTTEFLFKDKLVKGVTCSDFTVTEEARAALVPIRMLQTLLKGPQDFSFSDHASNISRLLWCKLGGEIAYPYSNYYNMPLRPFMFLLKHVNKNSSPWINAMTHPLALFMDKSYEATRLIKNRSIKATQYRVIELDRNSFKEVLTSLKGNYQLFPYFNEEYFENYLIMLKKQSQFGKLRAKAVINKSQNVIGWFIYQMEQQNRCSVIQAECLPGMEDMLIDQLKLDAFRNGCINISGRTSPSQFGTTFTDHLFNRPGKKWGLIHSKNQELLHVIQSGKAFLASNF